MEIYIFVHLSGRTFSLTITTMCLYFNMLNKKKNDYLYRQDRRW